MTLKVTLGEMIDHGCWDEFCNVTGMNPWSLNEGRADKGDEYELTLEQAVRLGLIRGSD